MKIRFMPVFSLLLIALCSLNAWSAVTDNVLFENEILYTNDYIESSDGQYRLYMQSDGNVVLYQNGSNVIFQSGSAGNSGTYLIMQGDGNLVAYNSVGTPVFHTGTHGNPGAFLSLGDDGRLIIYGADGVSELWSRGATACNPNQGFNVPSGVTNHFNNWLNSNGYENLGLDRSDLDGGSFGGKASNTDCIVNQPVIFVHGNGDRCMGGVINGWEKSVEYFRSRGYRSSELYCTTYGNGNVLTASAYYHSKDFITRIRKMVEAVKAYTGADKVDIIGHSLGVTVARKAIKGGYASDLLAGGRYYIGPALTSSVDTFVGIAGGNRGLAACYFTGPTTPGCGKTNGFYPGYMFWGMVFGGSNFLKELNRSSRYEGRYRYSIWSTVDEVVGGACLVWGRNTCRIPGQTGEKKFYSFPYGHIGVRDRTGYYQYRMVHDHKTR